MKTLFCFVILTAISSSSLAAEYSFIDSDCKLLATAGDQVRTINGEKSKATCVVVNNEASCNYTNLATGLPQGKPTKYETVKLGMVQIWTSIPSGNIKMLINEKQQSFIYGMTGVVIKKGLLLNKQCAGRILHQSK